jgi:hypothetical protein
VPRIVLKMLPSSILSTKTPEGDLILNEKNAPVIASALHKLIVKQKQLTNN